MNSRLFSNSHCCSTTKILISEIDFLALILQRVAAINIDRYCDGVAVVCGLSLEYNHDVACIQYLLLSFHLRRVPDYCSLSNLIMLSLEPSMSKPFSCNFSLNVLTLIVP